MDSLRTMLLPLTRLRRRVQLHRRGLAALLAALAAYVALQIVTATPAGTVPVWTASRDLPSGTLLTTADVETVEFAPGSVPEAAVRTRAQLGRILGRTLGSPMSQGETFTEDKVVRSGWMRGHPGVSAVPVRITDAAVVGLLHVGDRVALVSIDPQAEKPPTELVPRAEVLALPTTHDSQVAGTLPGRLVLLGVPAATATLVASASAASFLTVTWNR